MVQDGPRQLHFESPDQIITAWRPEDVPGALQAVETAVAQHNLYAAGFLTYEAGAAWQLMTHQSDPDGLPLLWFGLYTAPEIDTEMGGSNGRYQLGTWQPSVNEVQYHNAIKQIKEHIARGDTYQVNYTMRLQAPFSGEPQALYHDLTQVQQAQHTAYVDLGDHVICSASPELFFTLDGDLLTARPMKGTATRGRTLQEDEQQVNWLQQSEKNRAENVMIVDMIRNDMGRVAEIGSVHVPHLFTVERYPTLLQMTSTVIAHTSTSLSEIMAAMFPCASITGAPKVRTMQIIRELETGPRGIYTGAIGFLAPGRRAQFNVAIRTVVIDRERGLANYGVGSGIVWDSSAAEEYAECRLKTQVLMEKQPPFDLVETMLWAPTDGYFLLDLHLARLAATAVYFSVPYDETRVRQELATLAESLSEPCKVRLLLARDGSLISQASSLESGFMVEPVRVGLALEPVNSANKWLYHKTTRRDLYDKARASRPDCDEVILWNERGEISEAGSSNVVVRLDGQLLTPPTSAGLLPGTFREFLLSNDFALDNGRIQERTITIADLQRCDQIYLINSVRKWRKATLIEHTNV